MTWPNWQRLTPVLQLANFWDSSNYRDGFGPRWIEQYQLLFVQSGRGQAVIDDQPIPMEPGDLIFYGPRQCHQVRPLTAGPNAQPLRLIGMAFVFLQEDLTRLPIGQHSSDTPIRYRRGIPRCPLQPRPPLRTPTRPDSAVRELCERLVLSCLASKTGRELEKRGLLLMLFDAWHRALQLQQADDQRSPVAAALVRAAEQRLLRDPTHPPTVEQLAEAAALRPSYFARLFKQHTGLSIRQYVNQQRLLLARRLLAGGQLNASQAAHQAGFDDPLYFSRLFTKRFGIPPSQLRRQAQMP